MARIIVFLLILLSTNSYAFDFEKYKNFEDTNFQGSVSWSEKVVFNKSVLPINYRFSYVKKDISEDYIKNVLKKISAAIVVYADLYGYNQKNCRLKSNLDIYYVTEDLINDRKRFNGFLNEGLSDSSKLWAFYDPVVERIDYAVIPFSNQGRWHTESTIAHELSHYWYDRLCWDMQWSGSAEAFAIKFEKFYEDNYMER